MCTTTLRLCSPTRDGACVRESASTQQAHSHEHWQHLTHTSPENAELPCFLFPAISLGTLIARHAHVSATFSGCTRHK